MFSFVYSKNGRSLRPPSFLQTAVRDHKKKISGIMTLFLFTHVTFASHKTSTKRPPSCCEAENTIALCSESLDPLASLQPLPSVEGISAIKTTRPDADWMWNHRKKAIMFIPMEKTGYSLTRLVVLPSDAENKGCQSCL